MKLVCAPIDLGFKTDVPSDLNVVLYGHADTPQRGGIGANIRDIIRRAELRPAARAWDLLSIALSVIAADTAVSRGDSPDGWTREIDLQVAVGDPTFWSSQIDLVHRALWFLTTDRWNVSFVEGGLQPVPPKSPKLPAEDCVALLSGGLDSFIGAIDLTKRYGKKPYLVSQVSQGDKQKQAYFAGMIGGGLSHLQLNHVVTCPGDNERSQRARSVIFLAYGTLLATTLKQYHNGKPVTLFASENGFISINPPLTEARIGSLSTRTTHPAFLHSIQSLLDVAGLQVRIENIYQFKTKGEMLLECADQPFLRKHAHLTTSCGRYARYNYRHCGRCVPCLIRRAAFNTWKEPDNTIYVFKNLSQDDADHAGFQDVRAAGMAAARVKTEGLDSWLGSSLSSAQLGAAAPYKEVVARGLAELADFLRASGVK